MPNATITKRFTFEAAHELPNHDGQCRNLHGHSYIVEVDVTGEIKPANGDPDEGMVIDFHRVSAAFKERVHAVCDHAYLNDVLPLEITTAENIAGWILAEMRAALPSVTVARVRVWETATGRVEVE